MATTGYNRRQTITLKPWEYEPMPMPPQAELEYREQYQQLMREFDERLFFGSNANMAKFYLGDETPQIHRAYPFWSLTWREDADNRRWMITISDSRTQESRTGYISAKLLQDIYGFALLEDLAKKLCRELLDEYVAELLQGADHCAHVGLPAAEQELRALAEKEADTLKGRRKRRIR